jgi:hypothetical protein
VREAIDPEKEVLIQQRSRSRGGLSPDPVENPVDNTPFLSSIKRFAEWLFFAQSCINLEDTPQQSQR